MHHLDTLNPEQKKAATTTEGPLLIIAGAGAGKTKTIVHRILEIISRGAKPEEILAVTFTNKAAKEMRERVALLLPQGSNLPTLTTFHSLGAQILREHAGALGFTKQFIIRDQDESLSLIKELLKELGYDPKEQDPRSIRERISRAKNNFLSIEDYGANARTPGEKITARIWELYQRSLKKQNCVDFDDLLLLPLRLFSEHPAILESYQYRYKYIHIDEYQDTNEVQYRLAQLLSAKYKNLCVVGDADQTIYTWRGAKIENILKFEEDYPEAVVVLLEENYRSTGTILAAANAIIKKNTIRKDKKLFTKAGDGESITTFEGYDEKHEAM
jgi:DNA helicase-2/ATP-dependent DNA helicase PcrA